MKTVIDSNFIKYGYKSISLIINSGVSTMILFITLFCFLSTKLLMISFSDKIPKLQILFDYFHYGVFIKFWIQTSLEFLVTSVFTLYHGYFKSFFYFLDYCCSGIVLVIEI